MGKTIYPPGALFCRQCGYCLHGLPAHRCPECGHDFDPANPKTFRARPPRTWLRRVLLWGGIPLLLAALAYGGLLGWLYWGWKAEAPARALPQWAAEQKKADSSVRLSAVPVVKTEPLLPAGPRWMILPACRPWMERVSAITLEVNRRPPDLAERLAACRQIKKLYLDSVPLEGRDVVAISHLSDLTELQLRYCGNGEVLDDQALATIARLRNLQVFALWPTRITNRGLGILASLPKLRTLHLDQSPALTDGGVEALCHCSGLANLWLHDVPLSASGIGRLKAGLPGCNVDGYNLLPAPPTAPAPSPARP